MPAKSKYAADLAEFKAHCLENDRTLRWMVRNLFGENLEPTDRESRPSSPLRLASLVLDERWIKRGGNAPRAVMQGLASFYGLPARILTQAWRDLPDDEQRRITSSIEEEIEGIREYFRDAGLTIIDAKVVENQAATRDCLTGISKS
jgi:hypothetical protein